jgi:hypothetical protein
MKPEVKTWLFDIIWGIVINHLPLLREEVKDLLGE